VFVGCKTVLTYSVRIITANDVENWSAPLADTSGKHHVPAVRQADVDNHNSEGGFWVVSDGYVYDISHLRSLCLPQQVERCIRKCAYAVITLAMYFVMYLMACVKMAGVIVGCHSSLAMYTLWQMDKYELAADFLRNQMSVGIIPQNSA